MSGLGKGDEVVRREPEVGRDERCCVKVATRRLLEEQIAAVVVPRRGENVPGRGEKNDSMWHVPQFVAISQLIFCEIKLKVKLRVRRINIDCAATSTVKVIPCVSMHLVGNYCDFLYIINYFKL